MGKMRINLRSLGDSLAQLVSAQREIDFTLDTVTTKMGSQFASIAGLNEAGVIHGSAIKQDPASAQEMLRTYSNQLGWASDLLAAEIAALSSQEDSNSRGLDLAD